MQSMVRQTPTEDHSMCLGIIRDARLHQGIAVMAFGKVKVVF
jgi:hypothetical protein